jgi:mannan endo-1,4-beta-mannosidase
MKNMKLITMCATALAFSACASQPKAETPAEALLARLSEQISEKKIMFGHQDTYLYGHSWKVEADQTEFNRSDVHDVIGQYPALYGMDLGGIELDSPLNIDKNDFNHMRASAITHHERGGVITFSWHPMSPITGGNTWDISSTEAVA